MGHRRNSSLIFSSGSVTIVMAVGILAKGAVDLLIAAYFGLGEQTDAFFVAYTLPIVLESMVVAISRSGLVPAFVSARQSGSVAAEGNLFSSLINVALLGSLALTALALIAAPALIVMIAPGMTPKGHTLATELARTLFGMTVFIGPIAVMQAYLNSRGQFIAAASVIALRGLVILLTLVLFAAELQVHAVAIGVVVGTLLQAAFLGIAVVKRAPVPYRLILDSPELRTLKVRQRVLTPLGESFAANGVLFVDKFIASMLPVGSITAISYGIRAASVAANVLAYGLSTVSLSSFSAEFARKSRGGSRRAEEILVVAIRLTLMLGIPGALVFWALQLPLTTLIFERGAFDTVATETAAPVIAIYMLCLPLAGIWHVLRSYLYAGDRGYAAISLTLARAVAHIALAFVLSQFMAAKGVALAHLLGFLTVAVASYPIVSGEIKRNGVVLARHVGAVTLVGGVLAAVLGAWSRTW